MADLSRYDDIVIRVDATMSEYTGRTGWMEELTHLHEYLRDRAEDGEIYKVSLSAHPKYTDFRNLRQHEVNCKDILSVIAILNLGVCRLVLRFP